MVAATWGITEVVVEMAKSGADLNLQNKVCLCHTDIMYDLFFEQMK